MENSIVFNQIYPTPVGCLFLALFDVIVLRSGCCHLEFATSTSTIDCI